jgi:hypothetical protein
VEREYNFFQHFFNEKRKNQFIPLPWNIGEFMFRNINKIDKFENHFSNVNLNYAENIKGFDLNKIFLGHMLSVGFSNSFIKTILNEEEEGNIQSTHVHDNGYLETLLRSNDFYKKRGKGPSDRSDQYRVPTPNNTTPKRNYLTSHLFKKALNSSCNGGGEKLLEKQDRGAIK